MEGAQYTQHKNCFGHNKNIINVIHNVLSRVLKKDDYNSFAQQSAHQAHVLISTGTSSPCLPALWFCIIFQMAVSCLLGTGSESEPMVDRLTLMAPIWLFFKDSIQSD